MFRTKSKPRQIACLFTVLLAFSTIVMARAHAEDDDDAADAGNRLIVMADINHDGVPDLVEALPPTSESDGRGILQVTLGRSGSGFLPPASMPVLDSKPRAIAAADFNRDGIPDVIVGDDDGRLMLFLSDGTGTLTPAGDLAHFDSVVSVAVADFNRDGIPDIVVSDWRASVVTVLLGTANSSYKQGWTFPMRMPGTSPHVMAADFNGDGIPDLAVIYDSDDGDTYDVKTGNGDGGFTDAPKLSLVRDPNSHCAT
ncbi:MAG TPA: VCBS repeat-containing protein [Alloacidobacterium sp.]|nr:VCBS repeat-containing protein [Alloacidobacterium sp.]